MLPASNKGPSLSFGFPDVCLTPVGPVIVPIPYPNFAAHAMAATFSPIVSVGMIPALNLGSVIAMTTGDEPGVAHWTIKGPGTFDTGNPVVFIDKLPAINLTCQTDGNTGNNEPGIVVAPGAPHVLYTLRPPPAADRAGQAPPAERGASGDRSRAAAAVRLSAPEVASFDALLREPPLAGDGILLSDETGYLRLSTLATGVAARVAEAVEELTGAGARALVLDLCGVPGGELRAMIDLASDFLPRGHLVVTQVDADGDAIEHRVGRDDPHRFPLVLVVDGDTASAAELFAACLQDHGRAVVVGEPTFGKDTGQVRVARAGGEADHVTVARLQRPSGAEHPGARVIPDVPARMEHRLCVAAEMAARQLADPPGSTVRADRSGPRASDGGERR